jgi:hypothetical protein
MITNYFAEFFPVPEAWFSFPSQYEVYSNRFLFLSRNMPRLLYSHFLQVQYENYFRKRMLNEMIKIVVRTSYVRN